MCIDSIYTIFPARVYAYTPGLCSIQFMNRLDKAVRIVSYRPDERYDTINDKSFSVHFSQICVFSVHFFGAFSGCTAALLAREWAPPAPHGGSALGCARLLFGSATLEGSRTPEVASSRAARPPRPAQADRGAPAAGPTPRRRRPLPLPLAAPLRAGRPRRTPPWVAHAFYVEKTLKT